MRRYDEVDADILVDVVCESTGLSYDEVINMDLDTCLELYENQARLDEEQAVREKEHKEWLKQAERIKDLMWDNLEHSVIMNHKLEQLNHDLSKTSKLIHETSDIAKDIYMTNEDRLIELVNNVEVDEIYLRSDNGEIVENERKYILTEKDYDWVIDTLEEYVRGKK